MSLFTHPDKVWEHIKEWFVSESKEIIEFLKPVVKIIERDGKQLLIATAITAVQQAQQAGGSGSDKMSAALKSIEATLMTAGIAFVESEARMIAELALQNLKAKQEG
jgi:hypothetical protein